jgi:hypothetical protein
MRALRTGFRLPALLSAVACIAGCGGSNNGNFAPPSGNGDTLALTSNNRLVSFNRSSPQVLGAVAISGLQAGENILGIDMRPSDGLLYGLSSTGRVYTINTTNGTATLKSTLMADQNDADMPFTALSGQDFGVDFNPVPDRLRVISDTGQNLRINVDTGATITDGTLRNLGTTTTRTGITGTAYTNSFNAACRTNLFYIDTTNDRLLTTPDPNAGFVTEVGNLGVDGGTVNGLEIVTGANGVNTALAVLSVPSSSSTSTTQTLYTINLTNGAVTSLGSVTGLNNGETIRGLTAGPPATTPTQLAGNMLALTESNKLVTFNNAAPQKICTTVNISGLAANETLLGIDMRPADSKVYGLSNSGMLYTLNTSTGVASPGQQLNTSLNGTEFGIDFNPARDRLRIVSDTGQNLRVNVDDGSTITDGQLNPAGPVVTAAGYTNSFVGTNSTTLYVIDTASDRLMIQGQPSGDPNKGDLQAVGTGTLGVDVQAITGFEINGINNQALLAVTTQGSTSSDLYSVNLVDGTATRVNTIGGSERIRGLTVNTNPQVTAMGLTEDGFLVWFNIATPGKIDTQVPVTGLQPGETLIGFDIRPANGLLYAVGDSGMLYTIDPNTGGAIALRTLAPDPADATAPNFSALSGSFYGFDFNPQADRLRIVSDTNQNLRVNVDTGLVQQDLDTTGGTQPVAAAYTSNFANAPGTQLFVIDRLTSTLFLQNPPNNGTLTLPLPLGGGLMLTPGIGFDIVGGDNGLVLAALRTNGATQSTLYRIDLNTGAATAVGNIGQDGMLLRSFALRLQ